MRNEYEGTDHVGYVVETGHPELNQVLRVSIAILRWDSARGDKWTSQCEGMLPDHSYIPGPWAQYQQLQRSWGHTR